MSRRRSTRRRVHARSQRRDAPGRGYGKLLETPYIVVGLTGADKSRPDKETFFRIDYLKRTGTEADATYEYLPLLRNHRYLVNITEVGGPGFDTEEDARKGPAANIMYNVVVWNESTMSNVQYDGQYMLGSAMIISLL